MTGKKIKFALKMNDNTEVRTLQELKEAFELNQMTAYFLDGKLELWLLDRYYKELAEKISHLDKSDPELKRKLCEIFEVEYEEDSLSIEEIEERNERIKKLKEITDDEEIIKNVDKVAFSQEELADLLEEGLETIYLCGIDFHIPVSKKGITYIGIETKLDMTQEEREIYQENDIELVNLLEDCSVDNRLLAGNRNAEIEQIVIKIVEQIVSMIKILLKTAITREDIVAIAFDALENIASSSTDDAEYKQYVENIIACIAKGDFTSDTLGFNTVDMASLLASVKKPYQALTKTAVMASYQAFLQNTTGCEHRFLKDIEPYFKKVVDLATPYLYNLAEKKYMDMMSNKQPVLPVPPVAASTKQAAATTAPIFGSSKPVQAQPVSTSQTQATRPAPAPVVVPQYRKEDLKEIRFNTYTLNGKKVSTVKRSDKDYILDLELQLFSPLDCSDDKRSVIVKLNGKSATVFDRIRSNDSIEIEHRTIKKGTKPIELNHYTINGTIIHLPSGESLHRVDQTISSLPYTLTDGKYLVRVNGKNAELEDEIHHGDNVEIIRISDI